MYGIGRLEKCSSHLHITHDVLCARLLSEKVLRLQYSPPRSYSINKNKPLLMGGSQRQNTRRRQSIMLKRAPTDDIMTLSERPIASIKIVFV